MKILSYALAASAVAFAVPAAADTLTYNGTPQDGWYFGSGNDYSPANTTVLDIDGGDQMYMRFHRTFQLAPTSSGNTYSFALGTDPLSFDWGIDNDSASNVTARLTLTNVGTGQSFSYDPFGAGNDNEYQDGSAQNSFRFNWVPGLFDPNVDGTYRVDMRVDGFDGGQRNLSVNAVFGAGAVPEPATWALLILGFGFIGGVMRRKQVSVAYA